MGEAGHQYARADNIKVSPGITVPRTIANLSDWGSPSAPGDAEVVGPVVKVVNEV